ncbi:hypothetical protein OAM26_03995 [Porticoccaceae bacterium]|nr:hypothetical protein [Porticoccaceae bacterium]
MNRQSENPLEQQQLWREQLQANEQNYQQDEQLQQRLNTIRLTALQSVSHANMKSRRRWTHLAVAASLVLAVVLPLGYSGLDQNPVETQQQFIWDDNPLQLYGELDHYQWLVYGE